MLLIGHLLGAYVANLFKSRRRLEAENLFLRHRLSIALRRRPSRVRLRASDRALLVRMTRLWPSLLGLARIVSQPRSCGGIGRGSEPIGAGNPAGGQEDLGSSASFAT
jgi:hypothetical protein